MRSLRARIFLTVWPLFVVAILAVGVLSSRSARLELAQFEARTQLPGAGATQRRLADSIVAAWPVLRTPQGSARLQRLSMQTGDSLELLVLDTTGTFVASSAPSLREADIRMTPNGDIDLTRTLDRDGERQLQRLMVSGVALISSAQTRLGVVYQLPGTLPRPSGAQRMVAGIQRSVWLAVLAACTLAALGTWLLAYPVVAQVQRLTAAASSVQAKTLSTRVQVTSHDELGTLEQSFNRMAESLEQTELAKRQLISDLAHELRTPLTNVIGLLEAMRDGLRTPDFSTLQSTQDEALLLKQLIDELQQLALADAGGLTFDIRDVDAGVELQRAVSAFQSSSPTIRMVVPEHAVRMQADPFRLAQVLRNVLQNAITHTPPTGRISATLRVDGNSSVIEVADTGRGIPADQLPLIWDRFSRVDPSRDRATGGMGLGLALSKRMVEGMGGMISATSTVGAGTTIAIRLPARCVTPRLT
ncbi:MAG: sensor histidine kinase [Gemmatimonas sp.]|jgi:two-component system sensor histidine kinase BaeS